MSQESKFASINPAKMTFSLFEEFKNFAFKGNMIDLAVGVIIGAAFKSIVDSLVKSIVMPLLSVIIPGDRPYHEWAWTIEGKQIPYGVFLGDVVNFLIVSAALFLFVVKFLGWMLRTHKEEAAAAPPPLTTEQKLLMEIRDLLAKGRTA
jgi:large conductance mechanosensitive channel